MLPNFLSTQSFSSTSSSSSSMDMEGLATKALKTSLWSEMTLNAGANEAAAASEDIWAENVDGFLVDDLLDFSKDEVFNEEEQGGEEEGEDTDFGSVSSSGGEARNHNSPAVVPQLNVPAEEVQQLEWLSDFVEESFSQHSLPYPFVKTAYKPQPDFLTTQNPNPFSSKKRSRPETCLIFNPTAPNPEFDKPPAKKQQKSKKALDSSSSTTVRRCSHCGVQKTPQWRQGPSGDKTLCNACGVRYKSGRLLPEYRPASCPTFSSDVHSNSHRKVLEMRKKKEMMTIPRRLELLRSF